MTPDEFAEILEAGVDTPELWAMAALLAMEADYSERDKWVELFTDLGGQDG